MTKQAASVVNFGCRLNSFESEQIGHLLNEAGRDDLLVVNSCAVTQETERQVRQKIRKLVRENPGKSVAVVGCAAELNPQGYAAMSGVSLVLGNAEKLDGARYRKSGDVAVGQIQNLRKRSLELPNFHPSVPNIRTQVMIQNGCDHDCTFCTITLARGPSRSVLIPELRQYIAKLVAAGVREVVLSGVDISAYGQDLTPAVTLGDLVEDILCSVPDLPRLRLSSIDCIELDVKLCGLLSSEQRLMPHLHLSLQAGDDLILKRMKRRHLRQQAIDLCQDLRAVRPELTFGADLIAGFPTEDSKMFTRTMDLVEECGLTYLHVFPFSAREGTSAARIPRQVPAVERKRRAQALRLLGTRRKRSFLEGLVGSHQEILLENPKFGRTPHYAEVRLAEEHDSASGLARVRIVALRDGQLWGEVLPAECTA